MHNNTFLLFRFVSKPKKGLKFLQEKGLLAKEPEEVAKFFHSDVRVNKTAMGDYMGENDEWGWLICTINFDDLYLLLQAPWNKHLLRMCMI